MIAKPFPTPPKSESTITTRVPETRSSQQRVTHIPLNMSLTCFFLTIYNMLMSVFNLAFSWFVTEPHREYDAIYSNLPPIGSFTSSTSNTPSLKVAFQVWRPNPAWKRKTPGSPDFHICVVNGRDAFPDLWELEDIYTFVAQTYPVGEGNGKVVLAVVDNGVSNYMTIDDNLLKTSSFTSS
jgi:hypothetical protein